MGQSPSRHSCRPLALVLLSAGMVAACHRPSSVATQAFTTHGDTSLARSIRIRGHTGPPTGRGAVAYAVDSSVWCPRMDLAGVAWPPADVPDLPAELIDSVVVLRGPDAAVYARRCPIVVDAVVRITTRQRAGS